MRVTCGFATTSCAIRTGFARTTPNAARSAHTAADVDIDRCAASHIGFEAQREASTRAAIATTSTNGSITAVTAASAVGVGFAIGSPTAVTAAASSAAASPLSTLSPLPALASDGDAAAKIVDFDCDVSARPTSRGGRSVHSASTASRIAAPRRFGIVKETLIGVLTRLSARSDTTIAARRSVKTWNSVRNNIKCHVMLLVSND